MNKNIDTYNNLEKYFEEKNVDDKELKKMREHMIYSLLLVRHTIDDEYEKKKVQKVLETADKEVRDIVDDPDETEWIFGAPSPFWYVDHPDYFNRE